MKEFTEDEKTIAKNMSKEYRWMARDRRGSLFAFPTIPIKKEVSGIWYNNSFICINALFDKGMFKSINWEDDKPTLIRDIYDPQILDDTEREYLKAVLKPFREEVDYVVKCGIRFDDDRGYYIKEYLLIKLYDEEFAFPNFDEGKMYSGMELDKRYKLDELGITYTEENK